MMRANPEKFQLMVLNRKCNNNLLTSLVVGDTTIKSVNEVKLLGITIDTKLSFDSHVNILCKKGSRNMNILKRLSNRVVSVNDRNALMKAFVFSTFTYCPLLWHFSNQTMSKRLDKIYIRGLKFVLNDTDDVLEYEYLLFMYKCYYSLFPDYLNKLAKHKTSNHDLRDKYIVLLKIFHTMQYGYRTLSYAGCKLWNSLPAVWKEACDVNQFIAHLSKWTCYYENCTRCKGYVYHT